MRDRVQEFHRKFGHVSPPALTVPDAKTLRFRAKLIREEADEVADELEWLAAYVEGNPGEDPPADMIASVLGEACDELYVTHGLFVIFGVQPERYFAEVHRANMEKVPNPNGGGKPLKPDGWEPPDLVNLVGEEVRT